MKSIRNLGKRGITALIIGVVIIVVAGGVVFGANHKNGCASKPLPTSSSGACVTDAQTLANWLAYGIDGTKYTQVTGTFDAGTIATVEVAQTNSRLNDSGVIDKATWKQLCAIKDAPAKVVAAAKNAGC